MKDNESDVVEKEEPARINKKVKVITDAAVSKINGKYQGRAGVVLLDDNDKVLDFSSVSIGNVTNNEGEYQAMRIGLTNAMKDHLRDPTKTGSPIRNLVAEGVTLELYTDSQLVFNQLLGNNKTRKKSLQLEQTSIKKMSKCFSSTKVKWHRREADLAMLADFGSKHPRRTKAMFQRMRGLHVDKFVDRAIALTLKDESKAALVTQEESSGTEHIQQ